MFAVEHTVVITQVSTPTYPNRTKVFEFNFMHRAEGESTWAHLTDTFVLVLPRKLYFTDTSTGKKTTWDQQPIYGNPDVAPLIMRSDKITVSSGYSFFASNKAGTTFDRNNTITQKVLRFDGYITKIRNNTPIEIECKDKMFICQQTNVENKEWIVSGKNGTTVRNGKTLQTYSLEGMLKEMLKKSDHPDAKNITVKTDNYQHAIQDFATKGWTLAQVLEDLRHTYHLESFIRNNELRCGVIRYYPQDQKTHSFHFQKNIISDDLDYQRADDVRIGIIAKSINKVELVATNSAGKKKTKHTEIKVQVGDADGEIRTLFFWGITNEKDLRTLAEKKLPFYRYTGFRGSFTTFSLPKVKHGDIAELTNDVVPEMAGSYLVKNVQDIMTVDGGLKQRIALDIRIDHVSSADLTEYQKNGL